MERRAQPHTSCSDTLRPFQAAAICRMHLERPSSFDAVLRTRLIIVWWMNNGGKHVDLNECRSRRSAGSHAHAMLLALLELLATASPPPSTAAAAAAVRPLLAAATPILRLIPLLQTRSCFILHQRCHVTTAPSLYPATTNAPQPQAPQQNQPFSRRNSGPSAP